MTLEPFGAENAADVEALDRRRELLPGMAGMVGSRPLETASAPPMVLRENRRSTILGTIESYGLPGYPSVANTTIYLDPELARPGYATEACWLYVPSIFRRGAAVVHLEVLAFNAPMLNILRRTGVEIDATMREHAYAAGKFWDVVVLSFDEQRWGEMAERFQRMLGGRVRSPAALGVAKKS